ncbi:resuscitation-promoting factor [Actinomadura parmotrematis]|uniref:Transglycosylase family protein n=1 Tax=Actinomadura parmotrematis TaxID=2864039 RepID=A0ABS7FMN9_9ACTN|nr:resuscitation-promoting factor [Actinomadura parmotrematis]MBW8481641.1 transglycosylase family protein [Actinomadura parmotrematis]
MRRPPATAALCALVLPVALLSSGCGGDAAAKQGPSAQAPASDAPRATPTPRPVAIVIDGKRKEVQSTGTTVTEVLEQARVELGEYDLTAPERDQPAGDTIKITRLLSKPVVKVVRTEAPTVKKKDSSLAPFSQKEKRAGKAGVKVVKTALAMRKGRKVRVVLAVKVKSKPVARILLVGPTVASGGDVAKLNWAGLANCESHGNPKAINSAGYYGLYQFSLASWASVGGSGRPSDAPAAEQTYRAQLLYKKVGGRWQGQWPNCGRFLFS